MEFSIDDSLAAWNGVDNAKHVSPSSIPTKEIQVLMQMEFCICTTCTRTIIIMLFLKISLK